MARRYTAIQQVKAEGSNVILVDAGDAFQGTLYFNVWQGEEEAYFMNALGYQAMAVGNHEFDSGPAALADFIGLADFPVLSANIDASAEPTLAGLIPAYTVLDVAGEQIGVFGLTTEETAFISSPGPNVVFNDVVASAEATVAELEGLGINKIIALSHCGYSPDQTLAAAVDGIDVIVSGHSHTLLGSMEGAAGPYPTEITSPAGDTVLIVSAYEWGKYLGRLDVNFTADGKVESYTGGPIFIDESFAEDPTIAADVATFAEPIEELKNTVIGETAVNLEGTRALVRSQETNLANLICDAMLWETAAENTEICVQNGGGIRASIPTGDVTMGQVLEVLPFGNQIATFGLTGADIWAALENGVSCYEDQCGRFAQVGGLRYVFDPSLEVGSRIVSVSVKNASGGYDPIDPDTVYKLVSNDFMRRGGDGYDMFADNAIDPYDSGAVLADAVAEYIGDNSPVSPAVEGRITKLDKLVTILHTNDIHGVFPATSYYSTLEGVAYLATSIAAERAKNPNTLLIDAGDTFQGNAFAQYFRNATPNPIAGAMNMLDYDAFVIGNHEYNFGPTTFATMLGQLDFPILGSANVDDDGTYGFINDNVEDYITLDVDGVEVAIFGITNPEVPLYELPSNIAGLTFYPATPTAASLVPLIETAEDPDLMVALTHIGYDVYKGSYDKDKAMAEQVPGIDVIVGGHSHTTLNPAVMITSDVNPDGTLVAQTGAYATNLGKINVGFTGNETDGYEVVFREGYLLPANDVSTDAAMDAYLAPFEAELDAYTSTEIGQTTTPIEGGDAAYIAETSSANLQADSAVYVLTQNGIDVDFHLSGAMTDRSVAAGATAENPVTLTVDDMYTLMKYENSLVVMEMNGPQLKAVLERAYRNYYYYKYVEGYGGYSHYTTCNLDINEGGVITYNDTYPAEPDGNNVVSLVFNGTEVDFADADTYYNVSSVNYLAAGSCNFNDDGVTLWPLDQMVADTQYYVRDSVIDYIMDQGTISPEVEGRLQWVNLEPLIVLYTNDEHGWLQPYVAYGSPLTEGGAASLMGRFTEIEGYSPDADNFMLLSGGDNWTGPSITTWFEGEPMVEVMNAMGYDVSVIGNHEFDFGRDALNERIAEADYPFLSANIYYQGTTDLADFATPYVVKDVGHIKVGIVGLTTIDTETTTHPKNIGDLDFGDYEEALRREVPNMEAEGADLIIVVAHVCLGELADLAENVGDLGIDLMQGGHCHELDTRNTNGIPIISGGQYMRSYAKTVLFLDHSTHDVVDYTQSLLLNQYVTEEGNTVTPDATVQTIVDYWEAETEAVMGEVIGYTENGIPRGSWMQRNYVTDAWLWAYGTADFAMTNTGGFRADIDAGDITMGDIVGVLPFDNEIVDCAITGAQVVENLELRDVAVAGLTYTYHMDDGQRVVDTATLLADGTPLDMAATYHVLVNDFMYGGGDGFLFGQQDPDGYFTGIQWRQPVIDWTKHQNTDVMNPIDALIDDQPRAEEVTP